MKLRNEVKGIGVDGDAVLPPSQQNAISPARFLGLGPFCLLLMSSLCHGRVPRFASYSLRLPPASADPPRCWASSSTGHGAVLPLRTSRSPSPLATPNMNSTIGTVSSTSHPARTLEDLTTRRADGYQRNVILPNVHHLAVGRPWKLPRVRRRPPAQRGSPSWTPGVHQNGSDVLSTSSPP